MIALDPLGRQWCSAECLDAAGEEYAERQYERFHGG